MAGNRWERLSPRTRRILLIAGAIEGVLKIAALIDIYRRPPTEIRGTRARWTAAIVVLNSAGAVPLLYFLKGRRR